MGLPNPTGFGLYETSRHDGRPVAWPGALSIPRVEHAELVHCVLASLLSVYVANTGNTCCGDPESGSAIDLQILAAIPHWEAVD